MINFFLTCNVGATGHHRRPSGKIGKGREASVNPWELSGSVGNLHFDRFFTRFRHQIGQIWSYRGIHSTNRCEISRSFIWKGSRGLKDICFLSKHFLFLIGCLNVFVTKSVGNRFHELSLGRNDRLGLGTSKIAVLTKKQEQPRKNKDFLILASGLASAGARSVKNLVSWQAAKSGKSGKPDKRRIWRKPTRSLSQ